MLLRAFFLCGIAAAASINKSNAELPIADLGYAIYQASSYNETTDAYTFSNIRFAASPTRFGAPHPPLQDRDTIHNGSVGFVCPQSQSGGDGQPDVRDTALASEDCLFLDVIVPRRVLNGELGNAAVFFWLYGGGYTLGSKTQKGDPNPFLSESPSPVIWVAPNYRLGIFGWLGGPSFTLEKGTVPNAGLYDQRAALEWVQNYIHLFHGAKNDVTVMGSSAGAGSVLHHITAWGGKGEILFKKAVLLGPGFVPTGGHSRAESIYLKFLQQVGCSGRGIECLRAIDSETLQAANEDFYKVATALDSMPGPTIDGDYVPDLPSYLIAQGRLHKNISVLVADDINEGYTFTNPNDTASSIDRIQSIFPGLTNTTLSELAVFYPQPSNTTPYDTEAERTSKVVADIAFNSNRYALSAVLSNATYNLVSAIQPGYHSTFTSVLFGVFPEADQVVSQKILKGIRRFVMNFVINGNPNEADSSGAADGVVWPVFGSGGKGLLISGSNITVVNAVQDKAVLEWWAKGLVLS